MHLFRFGAAAAALAFMTSGAQSDETGFADSHAQRREGGRLCLSDHAHSGYGEGKTKSSASAAAIKSWAEFTAFEYGTSWARYSRAAGKSTKFTKESNGWSANIEARPCKG